MQMFSTLILAQGGQTGAAAGSAPAPQSGNSALVPLGIPTAAPKTAATEGQPLSTPAAAPGAAPGQRPAGMDPTLLYLMGGMLLLIIFTTWSGSRKEKKKRAELNSSLAKGDTVQMLGGIIGVVAEVRDDEVVVRMEEGKIRFAKSAVQAILKSSTGSKSGSTVETKPSSAVAGTR
ncbi:MAG: preprotein translocase subunit YajC [Planctomycetes bacterium]|nr:preprotein translocase subunit YajC [Planctomycetota bacterium]